MRLPRTARRSLFALGAGAALAGCATPVRMAAVPRGRALSATVLGLPNERFYPSLGNAPLEAEVMATLARGQAFRGAVPGAQPLALNLLAISGGGENGAFGAGLLG